jgi:ribosomal protein L23
LEQLFDVTVTRVRTMQMRRKEVVRARTLGATARWKKAVVTLKEGDEIAVFES